MQRADVYECCFDPVEGTEQAGTRPAVVVSHTDLNTSLRRAIVAPITTFRGKRLFASQVLVRAPEGGLSRDSVVLCEQLRVLDEARLLRRRGSMTRQTMSAVDGALAATLGLRLRRSGD